MQPAAKIFLVDDHSVIRDYLRQLLAPHFTITGTAADAPVALTGVAQTGPDLVVVDLSLRQSCGLELLRNLRAQSGRRRLLVLSMHEEVHWVLRARQAGANGYVTKTHASEEIFAAIQQVLAGQPFLSRSLSATVGLALFIAGTTELGMLTDRELAVARLLAVGYETAAIIVTLHMSQSTVSTHYEHMKLKLGVRTLPELIVACVHLVHPRPGIVSATMPKPCPTR